MADKDTITLKVAVDSKAAATGLKPLNAALKQTSDAADKTEAELKKIGGDTAKIKIDDDAITQARNEIKRLRGQIREDLKVDINTDTKASLKRIGELKRTIKAIDDEKIEVQVETEVDTDSAVASVGVLQGVLSRIHINPAGLTATRNAIGDIHTELNTGLISGLGAASRGLAAVGAAGAAAAVGIGAAALGVAALVKVAWELGQAAADVETQVTQLEALTGGTGLGAGFFADLQAWAAETPFAIDDATDAAKRLLAAGVDLKDVNGQLNDMGNISAASGVPISQIATVFAQMQSSGRASYEDLKQFADAGIPVWQTLSEKLNMSVADVQKMASEGKLGADAIDLVRESLNNMYPTAMADQAETFNGQLSTMKDNLNQTGQALGTLFLPLMTSLVELFNDLLGPVLAGAQAIAEWNAELEKVSGGGIIQMLSPTLIALDFIKGGFHDASDSAKGMTEDTAALEAQVTASMENSAKEVVDFTKVLEDAANAFGKIGANIRTRVSFIFDQEDIQDEIDKLVKEGIELPAHLKLSDLDDLGPNQQDLVKNISQAAVNGLEEGARLAKLNPDFDQAAWLRRIRKTARGQLIKVGVDPADANRVLNNIIGLPRTVPVNADITPAQKALNAWHPPAKTVLVEPKILMDRPAGNKPSTLALLDQGTSLASTVAPIAAEVTAGSIQTANASLNAVANPQGVARDAKVAAKVSQRSIQKVDAKLDVLAQDRHMTIYVHTQKVGPEPVFGPVFQPSFASLAAPAPAPGPDTRTAMVGMTQALTGPTATPYAAGPSGYGPGAQRVAGVPQGGAPAPVQLAPRQTPVMVMLDGVEIANRLELRRSLAAVESVRRTA